MEAHDITSTKRQYMADLLTPVRAFLQVRDAFEESLLLESSDYHSREDSHSIICCDPLLKIEVDGNQWTETKLGKRTQMTVETDRVLAKLEMLQNALSNPQSDLSFNGLYGYSSFEGVQYFDSIKYETQADIPSLRFAVYRYVIVFSHFNDKLTIISNSIDGTQPEPNDVYKLLQGQQPTIFPFGLKGEESSTMNDDQFKDMVRKAKSHCQRGDVFQLVLSRRFSQGYKGDDFNVYRALRTINPSPYLFYFDYGDFRIMGSSPEAKLVVKDGIAEVHPIAGTYRRTGDDQLDRENAKKLADDPKENAEHVMLVDLARNDLSRHCRGVEVSKYQEIQYFSHVIHLVSRVEGKMMEGVSALQVYADTFPAGTLSGAPKFKALELIRDYEAQPRGSYGGGIGMLGFNGDLNMAIIIRSFFSSQNTLHYQAGAGIVIASDPDNECQEVHNKLAALKKALEKARELGDEESAQNHAPSSLANVGINS